MTATTIKNKIEHAKTLDFGNLFNNSIELFKNVWVQGLVTLLLNMVMAIPVVMIVYVPVILFGLADIYNNTNTYDPYQASTSSSLSGIMIIVMALVYIFLIITMSTIGLGLKAAFYRICKLKDLEQLGREDYFYFFKKPYLRKTVKLGCAFSAIAIIATMLCFIPIIYAIVPLSFIVIIYAFNPDLSISEIIKLSFDLGNKKWLLSFGLMFVTGFLAMIVGVLMCGFGVYVTSSFSYLPAYFIYKEVVGFEEENEQMKRIENLSI
ncbi:hypothetical protein [Winogradskyella bathintestinalis]|uniref:DUF975 family protein n=1 Tax=Winogradskyella bathintestinalis TaxID=3035208 RepID=A0ABT7ZV07_9FLAO|nr:hypothetical protein [Winogradskyella bathintestinalis]MDN3492852.1 hypothetical protein [Winogradskyella bathintestinalis]